MAQMCARAHFVRLHKLRFQFLQISEPSTSVSHREVSTRCLGWALDLPLCPPLPCFPGDRERARVVR